VIYLANNPWILSEIRSNSEGIKTFALRFDDLSLWSNGAMDSGSTPVLYTELMSDLTVEQDASLEIVLEIETSTERNHMKVGTNVTFSSRIKTQIKVVLAMMIVGLLGFGIGPVASIGLSYRVNAAAT